jgi:hypothetical protein
MWSEWSCEKRIVILMMSHDLGLGKGLSGRMLVQSDADLGPGWRMFSKA